MDGGQVIVSIFLVHGAVSRPYRRVWALLKLVGYISFVYEPCLSQLVTS